MLLAWDARFFSNPGYLVDDLSYFQHQRASLCAHHLSQWDVWLGLDDDGVRSVLSQVQPAWIGSWGRGGR